MDEVLKDKLKPANQGIRARIKKPTFDAGLQFAVEDEQLSSPSGESPSRPDKSSALINTVRADSLLPTQGEQEQRFMQRAKQLSSKETRHDTGTELQQYQQFHVGRETFGIAYEFLEEIMYVTEITAVPCVPDFVRGVIAVASEFMCIVDLGILFQSQPTSLDDDASIMVVSGDDVRVGLLVSQIDENKSYNPSLLSQPMRSQSPVKRVYVEGIYKQTVTFLDLNAMLKDLGGSITILSRETA